MKRRSFLLTSTPALFLSVSQPGWAQDFLGWVEGQKNRIRKDALALIKAYAQDGSRGVKKELILQFIRNSAQFATDLVNTLDEINSLSALANAYTALGSLEKSLENIIASRDTPREVKALAEVALTKVRQARIAVRKAYVALGGDPADLNAMAKKFEPVPIVIVPQDDR